MPHAPQPSNAAKRQRLTDATAAPGQQSMLGYLMSSAVVGRPMSPSLVKYEEFIRQREAAASSVEAVAAGAVKLVETGKVETVEVAAARELLDALSASAGVRLREQRKGKYTRFLEALHTPPRSP